MRQKAIIVTVARTEDKVKVVNATLEGEEVPYGVISLEELGKK